MKSVLGLAWPTIGTFTILSLRPVIDVWLASRLGPEDLAALAPAQLVMIFLLSFGMGSLIAVNAWVSKARGGNRRTECGEYAWQGVWFAGGYGAIIGLAGYFGADAFGLFGHAAGVTLREIAYFRVAALSILPQLVAFAVINFLLGIKRPKLPMSIVSGTVILHAVIGYTLVFGRPGYPAMGIEGVAWALVVSTFVQAAILVLLLFVLPGLREFGGHRFSVNSGRLGEVWRKGIPIGLRDVLDNAVWSLVLIWLIGHLGTVHLAAAAVLLACLDVLILPCDGLGAALVSMVGDAYGRGQLSQARRWCRVTLQLMTGYAFVGGILFLGFRKPVLDFLAGNPGVSALAQELAFFVSILLILYALYSAYDHALCGAGDNLWPTVANLVICALVLGGGGILLVPFSSALESYGAWSLVTVNIAVVVAALRWRWIWRTRPG